MTDRLYENDGYVKVFEARVVACLEASEGLWTEGNSADGMAGASSTVTEVSGAGKGRRLFWIVLDRTAFFPEGGGQNADRGWLNDREVLDVQVKDGVVYHKTAFWLEPGQQVTGVIDWELRFSNMQQHSGEHIFSGLVHRYYGYNNVGFHLGSQVVTMDFDGVLDARDIDRVEWAVNGAIAENVPVTVSYPDAEALKNIEYRSKKEIDGQVRLVTVEGYDVCACCAPHVARTGEIGGLKVVDFQKYKGGTRVSMLCGFRMLEDYRMKQSMVGEISRLLSAPAAKVDEAVKRQLDENGRLRQEIYGLREQLMEKDIEGIPEGTGHVWFFKEALDAAMMRKMVNETLRRVSGFCGVFCGNEDQGYKFIIGTRGGDARKLAKELREALGARGGGSAEMIQGFVNVPRQRIEAVLPQ